MSLTSTIHASWESDRAQSSDRLLATYLRLFRRRWMLLALLLTGIAGAVVLAAAVWEAPFRARAVLKVPTTWTGSIENVQLDVGYTERLLNTYVSLSESGRLDRQVAAELGSTEDDGPAIDLEVPPNTELLIVWSAASDAQMAADGANATAEQLAEEIRSDLDARFRAASDALSGQLEDLNRRLAAAGIEDDDAGSLGGTRADLLGQREALQQDYNQLNALGDAASSGVSIVETADPPEERSDVRRLLLFAVVVACACAVALVIFVDRVDDKVYDIRARTLANGHVVLGEINTSFGRFGGSSRVYTDIDPQSISLAYRLKAASPRTLMTTSAHVEDMATFHVAELCRALASTGLRVVVIDTAVGSIRLAPILCNESQLEDHGQGGYLGREYHKDPELTHESRYDNLHVASARWAADFIGMSDYPEKALRRLEGHFDIVVVFVPAALDRAEASLLGKSVEGTLLIVGERTVGEQDLSQSFRIMEALPSNFLGVVVSNACSRPRRRALKRFAIQ